MWIRFYIGERYREVHVYKENIFKNHKQRQESCEKVFSDSEDSILLNFVKIMIPGGQGVATVRVSGNRN